MSPGQSAPVRSQSPILANNSAATDLRYALGQHYFGDVVDRRYEPTAFLDDFADIGFTTGDYLGGSYFDDFDE